MTRATSFTLGGSSRLGLLLAGVLAAITGILVFAALRDSGGSTTVSYGGGGDTAVVVANQDIPARTQIKADMLEVAKLPAGSILGGAFTSRDLVAGRVAKIPIYKGEQLVQDKLASQKTDLGLSYVVPEGQRAMAVKVDKVVGAGGLIRPGDRVDVVAVIEFRLKDVATDREITDTRSFMVAQNVEVLAVEQKLVNQVLDAGKKDQASGTLVEQPQADPEGTVVTLAISPAQTQAILLSEDKGKIRLAVRGPGDATILEQADATFLSLTDPAFQAFIKDALKTPKK
jgi:pilus assembly protein CpaB